MKKKTWANKMKETDLSYKD